MKPAFVDKLLLFSDFREPGTKVADLLKKMVTDKLTNSFPKVIISFCIYLSLYGPSREGERSFSALKEYCTLFVNCVTNSF